MHRPSWRAQRAWRRPWSSAQAVSFQSASGDWTGSWDTTIGYGQGWRVSGLDCRLIAIANGGCGYSPNIDDGDLNYRKKAAFSEAVTCITELGLNYKEKAGIFVRGSGLYDFEVMDNTQPHIDLTHDATYVVGSYMRLLDALGYWRFDLGRMPSELRVGRQVVDWGESTFIPGGLNEVDHFDVTALQVPGAELKQALLPDMSVIFNLQLSKNLSTQLLYLFDWHKDILEPDGAYFSTNDVAGPGGNRVILGFGAISDQGVDFTSLGGSLLSNFQAIPRLPDHKPSESGQYGVNFKLYLPNFSQGTELGFYFLNYTSRLPVVSFQTGTQAGFGNAFGAVNAVGGAGAGARRGPAVRGRGGHRRGRRPAARRSARRQPERGDRAAVRHHRRQHAAGRRQRQQPGEQPRDLRVRQDARACSSRSRRTSGCWACPSTRRSRRPAPHCRARSPSATTCRCSSTTSSCCTPRSRPSRPGSRSSSASR